MRDKMESSPPREIFIVDVKLASFTLEFFLGKKHCIKALGYAHSQDHPLPRVCQISTRTDTTYTLSLWSMQLSLVCNDSHISAGYHPTTRVAREGGLGVVVAHLCMRSLHRKGSTGRKCEMCVSLVQLEARVSSAKTR